MREKAQVATRESPFALRSGLSKSHHPDMKIGIIGSGMIAETHARAIKAITGSTLHSVYNHRIEGARKLAGKFGVSAHADLEAFLADRELEMVTICTPSGAHFEPALAAIEAGKHVIVEKPLEVTLERVDALISAAQQHGVTLASILNRRFNPAMEAFKTAVDAGRFLHLASASCYVKWFRDQAYYDSAAWRGTWLLDGGGVLMNQAIHAIDSLIHLAGPVAAVQANCACLAHHGIEVEDSAVAIVEFTNGARGVIEGSTCSWSEHGHPARLQLTGTGGSVFMADESFEIWDFKEKKAEDESIRTTLMRSGIQGLGANIPSAIGVESHQLNFQDFIQAILENREPSTSARVARRSIAVILAIYQSARNNGCRVIPDA
jgi:predicted dehydrogenase